jgi:hypothetical protein
MAQRGRKTGSVSFMQISLRELNRILQPDANVIVSLRYAQIVGLKGKAVNSSLDVVHSAAASASAEIELTSFDDGVVEPAEPKANPKKNFEDDDRVPTDAHLEEWT